MNACSPAGVWNIAGSLRCLPSRVMQPGREVDHVRWKALKTKLIRYAMKRRGTGSDCHEERKGLYERTGFQQPVQGKKGENWGENRVLHNIFVLCHLKDII